MTKITGKTFYQFSIGSVHLKDRKLKVSKEFLSEAMAQGFVPDASDLEYWSEYTGSFPGVSIESLKSGSPIEAGVICLSIPDDILPHCDYDKIDWIKGRCPERFQDGL